MHLVLQNSGDLSRCRNGLGMLEDCGGIICYDSEVVEVLRRRMLQHGCNDISRLCGV